MARVEDLVISSLHFKSKSLFFPCNDGGCFPIQGRNVELYTQLEAHADCVSGCVEWEGKVQLSRKKISRHFDFRVSHARLS